MFGATGSQLDQLRPATAGTPEAVGLPTNVRVEVTRIHVVTGTTGATVYLYHDDDGTVRTVDTRIFVSALGPNSSLVLTAETLGGGISVAAGGELAVEASVDGEATFTFYGVTQAPTQRGA